MNPRWNRLPSLLTLIIISLFCNLTIAVVLPISVRPRALALHPAADLPVTTTTTAIEIDNANGIRDVTTKTFTSSPFSRTPTTPIINIKNVEASFVKVAAVASSKTLATITPVSTSLIARDGSSTTTTPTSSSSSSSSSSTDADSQPGNINVQVWAPLVGIVAVIALLVLYTCFRKNSMNASMIAATRSANDTAANRGPSSGTANATRRRPRRTPSQVSTRSLPAYMMDPGEQEIVLARGGMRRNRSRPEMGDEMYDDDEYDEEDMEMDNDYDPNGRASQADRPLLNASPGLAPPASRHSRTSTFDTIQIGSEDSHRGLLRDADEMDDEHADGGGMTYMFGEATTGGQLQVYDENERGEEEHVEMSQLGGGVSVGSGSVSGSSNGGSAPRQRSATGQVSALSPPVSPTRHAPSSSGVSGFFSSFSTLLTNSFTSIAHSLSGMNAPMSGSTIGVGVAGGGGGGGAYSSMTDQQQRAMSPPRTTTTTTTRTGGGPSGGRNRRQNTGGTVGSASTTSALLAPSTPTQPPPPYEGENAANSRSSTDTRTGTGRSRSRSSPRPSFSTAPPNSTTNPSSSTLSLPQHTRTASSSNIPNNNASATGSSSSLTISAPLAHTVTRSTFQYPASGPTTEQIKFLSSREALGKFGMPYGEEAVAAAQAAVRDGSGSGTSAQEPPPPSFEDVAGAGSGVGAAATLSGSGQIASSPTSILSSNLATTSTSSATTPVRSDSLASRVSVRSNRNAVTGPRGPRNSLRKSTLTQSNSNVERERAPRPSMDSMDSVDTVDSFGIEMRGKRRDTPDSGDNGYWDGTSGLETQAPGQQQRPEVQTQPQQRRSNLPKLTLDPVSPISSPVLVFSDDASPPANLAFTTSKSTRSQKPQIIPKTAPKGFVMSSPPPSPTPTTSTHTHARTVSYSDSAELGVPFITFAPATPSGEGDSVIGHEYSRGFA